MSSISNDTEFRQVLSGLELSQQRALGALFVDHVYSLSGDERIQSVVKVAANSDASRDELARALKQAKGVIMDSYTRCGEECDWTEQAGYFVARAAEAIVMPAEHIKSGGPAWQAAMHCRMARNCELIDNEELDSSQEDIQQYRILKEFLES